MWVLVLDSATGTIIPNASFNFSYYNRGDGYYYVYFTQWNQAFTCGAPNFYTLWGNNDYNNGMTVWLQRIPPPPPVPPPPNCWT